MADNAGNKKPAPKVDSTLSKGLRILEVLVSAPHGKGVTELSRELDLSKSNTFRLLRTLSTLGYVKSQEKKGYSATMKVWQIGQQYIDHLDLPGLASEEMNRLSKITGEAIYLAVRDGLSVIYIDKVESTKPIRSFTPKGGSAPIHCVATGKALLAEEYDLLREQVRHHLTRYTSLTITSIRKLDKDMEDTRQRGFAIDHGEYRERILSFGAAFHLPNGEAVGAIGVSAPDVNLEGGQSDKICQEVVKSAGSISDKLATL